MPVPELTGRMRMMFWCVMILGTFVCAEVLTRIALDPPGLYPRRQEYALITDHPVRGYAMLPGATIRYGRGGHESSIRLNERGFRDGPFDEAREAGVRVLGVGDSFTFGLGVDARESWPEVVEGMFRVDSGPVVSVVNGGVPGYSARQMRQVVEELMPELRPALVVFGMNSETYWRVNGPYVFLGGELITTSALPQVRIGSRGLYYSRYADRPWLNELHFVLNQHFELGAHLMEMAHRLYGALLPAGAHASTSAAAPVDLEHARRVMKPALDEILRARDVARAGGADFLVLLINPQSPDGSFAERQSAYNRVVSDFCSEHDIGIVDPLPALVHAAQGRALFRTPDDYHWTRKAHDLAGAELYRHLTTSPRGARHAGKSPADPASTPDESGSTLMPAEPPSKPARRLPARDRVGAGERRAEPHP